MLEQQSWDNDGTVLCEVVGDLTGANKFISYTLIVRACVNFQTDVWTVSYKFTNTSELFLLSIGSKVYCLKFSCLYTHTHTHTHTHTEE